MIFKDQCSEIFVQKIQIIIGFENCHESNMNINIWRKIFKYLNIFEYLFEHCYRPEILPSIKNMMRRLYTNINHKPSETTIGDISMLFEADLFKQFGSQGSFLDIQERAFKAYLAYKKRVETSPNYAFLYSNPDIQYLALTKPHIRLNVNLTHAPMNGQPSSSVQRSNVYTNETMNGHAQTVVLQRPPVRMMSQAPVVSSVHLPTQSVISPSPNTSGAFQQSMLGKSRTELFRAFPTIYCKGEGEFCGKQHPSVACCSR